MTAYTVVVVLLAFALFFVGWPLVLWRETKNATRTRLRREEQARIDKERFDRELTDDAIRAGAR